MGQAHGARRAEAELARSFLLQGRGGERRLRIAPHLFALNALDGEESGLLQHGLGIIRRAFVADRKALKLRPVELREACRESLVLAASQLNLDAPVFLRSEDFDVGLPLADQAQRDRLHPPGRAAAGQLAPEHGRERETDQVIERTARQVGVDQLLIKRARPLEGFAYRLLRDLVEDHALDRNVFQHAPSRQLVDDMPGDGLAFAVRVGGEDQLVGVLDRLGDLLQLRGAAAIHGPAHVKVGLGPDRTVLGLEVADMAVTGQHLVVVTEIAIDRLGFGW